MQVTRGQHSAIWFEKNVPLSGTEGGSGGGGLVISGGSAGA